jgi:hypothetical protein
MGLEKPFAPLLGNWTGTEQQEASAWSGAISARAAITFKLDLGGTAAVQEYRQVRADGQEFLGHGVFLLEPGTSRVLWWLFDSYGYPPEPAAGGWDGAALALTKVTPRGAAYHRFTVDGDRLDYRIETAPDADAAPAPFLAGRYRRVSGH